MPAHETPPNRTNAAGSPESSPAPPRARLRFGLGSLMLAMTVFSAMGAIASYLVQSVRGQRSSQVVFIIFCLAAPACLLVAVSAIHFLLRRFGARNRR